MALEKVVVVGRVVGDGDQRLSARGVTIEGSVAMVIIKKTWSSDLGGVQRCTSCES